MEESFELVARVVGAAIDILCSDTALRCYVALLLLATAGLSAASAAEQISWVNSIRKKIDGGGEPQRLVVDGPIGGRIPTNEEKRARQLADLRARPIKRLAVSVWRLLLLFIYGVVMPTATLSYIVLMYDFFFPGSSILTNVIDGGAIEHPSASQIMSFLSFQLFRSTPADTLEFMFSDVPLVSYNSADRLFSFLVWSHRVQVELAVAALTFFVFKGGYFVLQRTAAERARLDKLQPA